MPESTSLEYPVRDTAVRTASDGSHSDAATTISVTRTVGFDDSDTPFLAKLWAEQSDGFREDYMEYVKVTGVDTANNQLTVERDVEGTGAVSLADGDPIQPMVARGSVFDTFSNTQDIRDQLKLSVDTGPAENVGSRKVDFVAQVLSIFYNSGDVFWEYEEQGGDITNNTWGGSSVSEAGTVNVPVKSFDGGLDNTLTEAGRHVNSVAIGDGYVAYGENYDKTYVHDLSTGNLEHTLTESTDTVNGVSIGGGYVAYGGFDGKTYVHDLSTGNLEHTLTESTDTVDGVAIGGGYVAYVGGKKTYVHDLSTGNLEQTLTESGSHVGAVEIRDGYIAYGGGDENTYVHDLSTGNLEYTLTESGNNVNGVAVGGGYVAYGGVDRDAYVHDLSTGNLEYTLTESGNNVQAVDIADGYVAYGSTDNNTYVHDLSTGNLEQTLTESEDGVYAVAIRDGYIAYGGTDDNAYVHIGFTSPLSSNTKYKYRAVLQSNGLTRKGQIQTFTTAS